MILLEAYRDDDEAELLIVRHHRDYPITHLP
jgi:hypothetical protein